eukprot:scaffold283114_cov30-Tisochrysis_lutea.AAC.3
MRGTSPRTRAFKLCLLFISRVEGSWKRPEELCFTGETGESGGGESDCIRRTFPKRSSRGASRRTSSAPSVDIEGVERENLSRGCLRSAPDGVFVTEGSFLTVEGRGMSSPSPSSSELTCGPSFAMTMSSRVAYAPVALLDHATSNARAAWSITATLTLLVHTNEEQRALARDGCSMISAALKPNDPAVAQRCNGLWRRHLRLASAQLAKLVTTPAPHTAIGGEGNRVGAPARDLHNRNTGEPFDTSRDAGAKLIESRGS